MEALGSEERWLFVSNAPRRTPLDELVRAASRRHLVEEAFENAKGEVGLDHHEVRAWRGWHHHMTASLMALWFLVQESRRLGEKAPLSVSMVRFMISEPLRQPLSPNEIAARCRYQMRRNEEARIGLSRARGLEPPSWRRGRDLVQ